MKILVADDDDLLRPLMQEALEGVGHTVELAADGREAWDALTRARHSVLISDWLMPGMDGLALCRKIRALADPEYTYIILLTGLGGKANYLEGMEAGADDFMTKPFDLAYLQSRLRVAERVLGLQRHVRQLEGLLPVCSCCKRIQDEHRGWITLESYLGGDTRLSHGICPTCHASSRGGRGLTGVIG